MENDHCSVERHSDNTAANGEIELCEQIGKGSYGEVYQASWQGRRVAAKRIHSVYFDDDYFDSEIREHYIEEFRKEWEVLRTLDHPNIVRMYTVLFPAEHSPIIVTELLHCDLSAFVRKSCTTPKVIFSDLLKIGLGTTKGLAYLHGFPSPIVHRDLACKNILLTVDGRAKIADLGVAKVFASGGKDMNATAVPGTPVYAAPETYPVIAGHNAEASATYGVKVDIFSLGVVLLVMVVGREPTVWPPTPITPDGKRVDEHHRRKKDISEMGKDHPLSSLILQCLLTDSGGRPTAQEVVTELQKQKQHSSELAQDKPDGNPDVILERVERQPYYDHEFKLMLIGDFGVGKSCLLRRFKNPHFNIIETTSTIGVEIDCQVVKYGSKCVHLQILDTAGQEQFLSVQPMYFRAVHGIFLVSDVTRPETFRRLSRWIDLARQHCTESGVQMLIVGNKVDQVDKRKISFDDCESYADHYGFPYVETSALDPDSIERMYKTMIEVLSRCVDAGEITIRVEDNKDTVVIQHEKKPSKCPCKKS